MHRLCWMFLYISLNLSTEDRVLSTDNMDRDMSWYSIVAWVLSCIVLWNEFVLDGIVDMHLSCIVEWVCLVLWNEFVWYCGHEFVLYCGMSLYCIVAWVCLVVGDQVESNVLLPHDEWFQHWCRGSQVDCFSFFDSIYVFLLIHASFYCLCEVVYTSSYT